MNEALPASAAVLIVGAGPTGLSLANVLTRYGITVRIIERKARLSRHTKATNLMQRTQELISALGFLAPLNEISGHMRRLMVHAYGKCLGPRTMRLQESPFTDVLLCGQHNFEAVAAQMLSSIGVEVKFNTELVQLVQDADGCTATFVQNGTRTVSRFLYVVGCDGAAV